MQEKKVCKFKQILFKLPTLCILLFILIEKTLKATTITNTHTHIFIGFRTENISWTISQLMYFITHISYFVVVAACCSIISKPFEMVYGYWLCVCVNSVQVVSAFVSAHILVIQFLLMAKALTCHLNVIKIKISMQ